MTCGEVQDSLVALLHHELSCGVERQVQDHTSACAACREDLDQTRAISHAIRELVPTEPSVRERRRMQERILNATGQASIGGRGAERKALPHIPVTHMLPAPNPTRLLGFAGLPAGTSHSVSTDLPAEARATQRVEARRSARNSALPGGRMAAWAGLLCWIQLGVLVLAAGLLAAAYAPKPRARASVPAVSTSVQRSAESRWNERRMAKAYGHSTETFLTGGSVQLREQAGDGTLRVLPHFVPVTGEMCLIIYREDDIRRMQQMQFGRNLSIELSAAMERVPIATLKDGAAELPLELVDKFIGAENRATVLMFSNRVEIWSATRLEKYLGTQPRFDLVGVDIQGVIGLPEP